MDNLTHSLVGALLGQMGLKKKTGLAMPTLLVAANLPDVDALFMVHGIESLAMRRGVTHGPLALLCLPIVLWAFMIAFDRWQRARAKRPVLRPKIHKPWLLLLAFIGCASHPALDWLNNYGIRLLEPFSAKWFYGDTLFIIDVWIWAALMPLIAFSLLRERKGGDWQRPAWIGFAIVSAYIFVNGLISSAAERAATSALRAAGHSHILAVASPPPLTFWKRDIFWRSGERFGSGEYLPGLGEQMDVRGAPIGLSDPAIAASIQGDPAASAFLFWSRMPVVQRDTSSIVLRDQRFMHPLARGRFEVRVTVSKKPRAKE